MLVTLLAIYSFIRNDSIYSVDKGQTKAKIEATINNINLHEEPVYSNVADLGCGDGGVGLATAINCNLLAERYYKSKGNIKNDILLLNQQLKKQGWSRSSYSYGSPDPRLIQQSIAVSRGEQEGSTPYRSSDKHAYLRLDVEFFEPNQTFENYRIKKLIDDGKITLPNSGETIYGANITKTYWSCQHKSLFKLPCPAPPSKSQ